MPNFDVNFEVFCGTCGKGLCSQAEGRNSRSRVDVICGGFPCPDISYAGAGAGLAGERSGLFYEFARIISELEPEVVVLENVAALLTRGLDSVLGTLASIGYDAEWHCLQAADVGAPHIRDRVFVIAYAQSERCRTRRPRRITGTREGKEDAATLADARVDRWAARRGNSGRETGARFAHRNDLERCAGGEWWATEPAVDRVAHGVPDRVDRLRGLGNAVVPQVAEWIGRRLTASM